MITLETILKEFGRRIAILRPATAAKHTDAETREYYRGKVAAYEEANSYLKKLRDEEPDETKVSRFALYWYADEPGKVYLSNLFVPEDQRGKGDGSKALKIAIRAAVNLGAEWLYLRPASAEVVAWYMRRGFEPCDKDLVWMRRNISGAEVETDADKAAERDAIRAYKMPEDGDVEKAYKILEARMVHEGGFKAGLAHDRGTVSAIVKEIREKVKSCHDHAIRGAKVNFSGFHQGKIDLCETLLEAIEEIAKNHGVEIEEGQL